MKQRWELERLEEERRQMAALRQKAELGYVWEGPHPSPAHPRPASLSLSQACPGNPESRRDTICRK